MKKIILLSLFQLFFFNNIFSQDISSKDKIIKISSEKRLSYYGEKIRIAGMYRYGASYYSKIFPRTKGIPDSLNLESIYCQAIDDAQAVHQGYKYKRINKEFYNFQKKAFDFNFKECTDKFIRTYLQIAIVKSKSEKKYYIIDSNSNSDFSDDKIYELDKSEKISHKFFYQSFINNKKKKDSTSFTIYNTDNSIMIKSNQYFSANLKVDNLNYEIITNPRYSGSRFPEIIFINKEKNIIEKYEINNLVKINNTYFRISNLSKDLRTFDLIKTNKNSGSNQLDYKAFSFKELDINDNQIRYPKDFKNKYVLLNFWNISCKYLVDEMIVIAEEFSKLSQINNLKIIGIANDSKKDIINFINLNKITDTQIQARGLSHNLIKKFALKGSPKYYLISPEGIIIDKGRELNSKKIIETLLNHIKK